MRTTPPARRGGFTLVELMVVVGIMLVLIGLSLLVANSGLVSNVRLTGGSDRIAGWLMQARAKAKRDGAPRGIRFIPDPANPTVIREAQLIEVPDPYNLPAGNRLMIAQWPAAGGGTERHIYVVGPNAGDVVLNVAVGDTLSIPSSGTIHRITALTANVATSAGNATEISVADPTKIPDLGAAASAAATTPPTPTYATGTFGFIRQARPTFGEASLLVSDGIAIAINPNNTTDPSNTAQPTQSLLPTPSTTVPAPYYDVVFSPNGEIQNTGGLGRIVLWVRNPEAIAGNVRNPTGLPADQDKRISYLQAGEMSLVTVYSRTGSVAVHPVNLPANSVETSPNPGHDPYQYTKDGIASGL